MKRKYSRSGFVTVSSSIIACIITAWVQTGFADDQQGIPRDNPMLFPVGTRVGYYSALDNDLKLISKLPFSVLDEVSLGTNGWFAGVSRGGDSCVTFARYDESGDLDVWRDSLGNSVVKSVIFKDNVVFAGGNINGDLVAFCDLSAQVPRWVGIPAPAELGNTSRSRWKSVDALLLDGNRLIAVDNVVLPKWLISIDVTNPEKPEVLSVTKLKEHGTYEHVHTAALGKSWLAVSSTTASMGGPEAYISLLEKQSLEEQAVLSIMPLPSEGPKPWPGPYDWDDISLSGDRLYVAAGLQGIGILDIPSPVEGEDFQVQCNEGFKFIKPPQIDGVKVVRVIPDTKGTRLGVVIEKDLQISSITLDLSTIQKHLEDPKNFTSFSALSKQHREYWDRRLEELNTPDRWDLSED
jgi:hypothetical protein